MCIQKRSKNRRTNLYQMKDMLVSRTVKLGCSNIITSSSEFRQKTKSGKGWWLESAFRRLIRSYEGSEVQRWCRRRSVRVLLTQANSKDQLERTRMSSPGCRTVGVLLITTYLNSTGFPFGN